MDKKIHNKICVVTVAILLTYMSWFLAHNPHIPNYLEQKNRLSQGMEYLIDPNDASVVNVTAYIIQNEIRDIAEYVYTEFPYKSDYDTYWNEDYWATPGETSINGGGDCEDQSIYLTSVIVRLKALGYIEVQELGMVRQPTHVYVEVDNQSIGYLPPEVIETRWDKIDIDMRGMPWERVILLGLFWGGGWSLVGVYVIKK